MSNITNNKYLFDPEKVNKALKQAKSFEDLFDSGGALQLMLKNTMENMLKAELEDHLGYAHKDNKNKKTTNSRNGSYKRTLKTTNGKLELDIPRDRDSSFEPQILPKHQSMSSKIEQQIISMYAKGMTTRDIETHIRDIYLGLEISPTAISNITEKVLEQAQEWQSRPLEELYPIVFFDAIHFKVRQDGKIISKAAYTCLAINKYGYKDVLGIYIGENESSSFWLSVLTDLQNRGINDILIACVDGLKGFPEAIASIYPKTEVQTCIVHQIRNSLKYVGSKHQKEFMKDLKQVYQATSEEVALKNLELLNENWGQKYPVVINSWQNNWATLASYFKYTTPIRKIIYTTNIVENLHRQMRKVTKNRAVFPSDEALFKLLYLATQDIMQKWNTPKWNWGQVIAQLALHFPERVRLDLL